MKICSRGILTAQCASEDWNPRLQTWFSKRLETMQQSVSGRAAQRRIALAQAGAARQAVPQERRGELLPDAAEQLYQLREARVIVI